MCIICKSIYVAACACVCSSTTHLPTRRDLCMFLRKSIYVEMRCTQCTLAFNRSTVCSAVCSRFTPDEAAHLALVWFGWQQLCSRQGLTKSTWGLRLLALDLRRGHSHKMTTAPARPTAFPGNWHPLLQLTCHTLQLERLGLAPWDAFLQESKVASRKE